MVGQPGAGGGGGGGGTGGRLWSYLCENPLVISALGGST